MGKVVKVAYELLTLPPEDVDISDEHVEFGEEAKVEVGGVRDAVKTLKEYGCTEMNRPDDYYGADAEIDYSEGTEKRHSCRLEGFTPKQLTAIDMLMKKK